MTRKGRKAWNRTALEIEERAVEAYLGGLSLGDAGEAAGISPETVKRALRDRGVPLRSLEERAAVWRANRKPRPKFVLGSNLPPEFRREACRLYALGHSFGAAARRLGCPESRIKAALQFEGVEPRSQAEAIKAWRERLAREAAGL